MTTYALPANAQVVDQDGKVSQPFRAFLRGLGADASRVGDYLQTARQTVDDGWLLCDGREVGQGDYPNLYAVLKGITAPGADAGTFKLPSIPAVYDEASPGPNGTPVMQTWIKAL